jgi:hypothetical protein
MSDDALQATLNETLDLLFDPIGVIVAWTTENDLLDELVLQADQAAIRQAVKQRFTNG